MIELPPDMPRLRTLRTWYEQCLREVTIAITAAEQKEREQEQHEQRRATAAEPPWLLGIGPGEIPEEVHAPGCPMAGQRQMRPISAEEARRALAETVPACQFCRPDSELGIL
ncbi:DUF6233 domain-containing protein [Streptomyces cyaneofuscatus]|uniref:DUF6233 domain-containing protein n=1 Tax=Streptomyces cyaneofuscatus TaxID=66883 RepID=UPI003824C738